jgi:hypothetical protein
MTSSPGLASRPVARHPTLWPREHGAYIELLAPLLASLLFLWPSAAALSYALAACAAFLAHEPLLVLLGRRGARTKQALEARARTHLTLCSGLAALGMGMGAWLSNAQARGMLVAPLLLSLLAGWFVLRNLEKTFTGELVSATALAAFALPVLVASGAPALSSVLLTLGWASVHTVGTLTARAFIYRKREGKRTLHLALAAAVFALGAGALLYASGLIPFLWCLAPLPFAALALALATQGFCPRTPKQVGWALLFANGTATLVFGLGLQGGTI